MNKTFERHLEGFACFEHEVDFCVIGGGLSGICAAVAAARHGTKVLLMQDRPMFGGNASSEIRMWISGAHGDNMRETGLQEEMQMENQYRNPDKNAFVWDGVMFALVKNEPNIESLLNCACYDCEMRDGRIVSVTGYQMTTQQVHKVRARLFADCSGDSVLAPLTGAAFRMGREARGEFDESISPVKPDSKTMGMTISLTAREESRASTFIPPAWAYHYTKEDLLPYRLPSLENVRDNMWYVELGGEADAIGDTETLRDELLKIAYGIWDYLKNDPENCEKNRNWRLDWVGILPGKRESRRYVGDYIMNQRDVEAGGPFEDIIAYGGWKMDDHHPGGFMARDEKPTIFHPAPSPYGIPYRCVYARDIPNLMFAGRNISVTHAAVSSTRVQATCALLGQAVGTAASVAIAQHTTPRGVYQRYIGLVQQMLMEDDCYLPGKKREIPQLTRKATLVCAAAHAQNLLNGHDRTIGQNDNGCYLDKGSEVRFVFDQPEHVSGMRLIFDSNLNRDTVPEGKKWNLPKNILHNRPLTWEDTFVPPTMTKCFQIVGKDENGKEMLLVEELNNYQRLCQIALDVTVKEIAFIPTETWGHEKCHVFSVDVR